MKAMILAAGLGTRLRPLTDTRPKALVEVAGRTLLEITLMRLRSFGVNEVIINVHHFAEMVVNYLESRDNFGMRIAVSREDDLLLDTGGGLKKAAWFFLRDSREATASRAGENKTGGVVPSETRKPGKASTSPNSDLMPDTLGNFGEPFFLHNVDVISNIDFRRMLQFHNEHRALATLAVQSRPSSRLLLFNDQLRLVGRAVPGATKQSVIPGTARNPGNLSTEPSSPATPAALPCSPASVYPERGRGATRLPRASSGPSPLALAFSGIHVISTRLLPMLSEEGVFSIIDAYLRLSAQGEKILAFHANEYYWRDLGRPSDLSQAALDLQQGMY